MGKQKRLKWFVITLALILFLTLAIPAVSSAQSSGYTFVNTLHKNWAGYNGNKTVYMSYAIASNSPNYTEGWYTLPTGYDGAVQPGNENSLGIYNAVETSTGQGGLHEYYDGGYNSMQIEIPVVGSGAEKGYVGGGQGVIQLGLNTTNAPSNVNEIYQNGYNWGINTTGQLDPGSTNSAVIRSLALGGIDTLGFITGTEIVLIPAVTAYDLWGGYIGAFSTPATQLSGNSTLYANYAIVNGSIHNSNNPGINQDVYSAGAKIEVTIPYTDFNSPINFRLYAGNFVGSAAGDLYQGAISYYNFSAMPAAEIAGKVSLTLGNYKTADPTNTYINIEQSVVQGSTIYNTIYQVAPQSDGSYRFFAAPNTDYSVWATYATPYGYVNSTATSMETGPPGGYNIPQWQNANI